MNTSSRNCRKLLVIGPGGGHADNACAINRLGTGASPPEASFRATAVVYSGYGEGGCGNRR